MYLLSFDKSILGTFSMLDLPTAKGGSKVFPDPKQKGAFFMYKGKKSVYFCKPFLKDPKNCTKGKDCKFLEMQ